MRTFDADYYERRAAREREHAATATPHFAAIFVKTAEELERRAALCRQQSIASAPPVRRVAGSRAAAG